MDFPTPKDKAEKSEYRNAALKARIDSLAKALSDAEGQPPYDLRCDVFRDGFGVEDFRKEIHEAIEAAGWHVASEGVRFVLSPK